MGKLAASILAADFAELAAQVARVESSVDIIHIDVMDGHFVPPITLGGVVVKSLRPHTSRTFHGHLMIESPEAQFDELAEAGMEIVSFHLEAVPEPLPAIAKARGAGMGAGIVVNMETPIEAAFPFLDEVDDVMLMSIRPGWSGQSLDPSVFERVEAIRTESDRRGLVPDIEVDGGINLDNAQRAIDAGATVLIAASAIFWAADPPEAARRLAEIARGERQ